MKREENQEMSTLIKTSMLKEKSFLAPSKTPGKRNTHTDLLQEFQKTEDQFMALTMITAKCMRIAKLMFATVQLSMVIMPMS